MRDYFDPGSYDDDLFEAEAAKKRAADRAKAEAAQLDATNAQLKFAAQLKARMDERAAETNRRQLIAEYQAAGVEPPMTDGNGKPTVSLSMLLRMGWSLENISGQPTLIRPFGTRAPVPPVEPEPVFGEEPVFGAPRIEREESENPAPEQSNG